MTTKTHWPSSIALAAYLLAVLALGFIHAPGALALALVAALIAAGGLRWQLLRRSLRAMLLFNLCVSLGYALMLLWQGQWAWWPLVRINLRVMLLVFLGFWLIRRVNVLRALAFAPPLAHLAAIAAGQAKVFARMGHAVRLAAISRSAGMRLPLTQRLRHAALLCVSMLDKSIASADNSARAMRARGCFDD